MADTAILNSINPEELARCLFDESSDGLFIFEPESLQILDANPQAQRLTGTTSRKLLLEKSVSDLFTADDPKLVEEMLASCRETKLFHSRESHQLLRPGGEPLQVNISVSRLHTSPCMLGVISVRDIGVRRQLEDDLRHTQSLLQGALNEQATLLEHTSDRLSNREQRLSELVNDVDAILWETEIAIGEFTYVSSQAERILGYPVYQWFEEPEFWQNRLHEDDAKQTIKKCIEATQKGQDHEVEYRMRRKDGRVIWVRDVVHVVKDSQNVPVKLRGVMIDVSRRIGIEQERLKLANELRKRERELAHVARLSTMGQMVAGIAHEINQPLSAISNFANAAVQALSTTNSGNDAPLQLWMEQIAEQAVRCGDIIRRLRSFTRKDEFKGTDVNLQQLIGDSIALLQDITSENGIHVETNLPQQPVFVNGCATQLQQVVVNLLRNAFDATLAAEQQHPSVVVSLTVLNGAVEMAVQDNGTGIDEKTAAQLFEAFHTTRADGMGLGLAISRSIIESHDGQLTLCDSDVGAKFAVTLPTVIAQEQQS